jgi:hypothetical protein
VDIPDRGTRSLPWGNHIVEEGAPRLMKLL